MPPQRSVLLVDDEPVVRRISARMLEHLGYAPLEADSAGEAIALLSNGPSPIALIADIRMPGIPGTRLAWMVREQLPELPVLFVSGFPAEVPTVDNLIPRSAFLMKPFTLERLRAALDELLS